MAADGQGLTLQVQVVLYRNRVSNVWRLIWGLATACSHATRAGLLTEAHLALGDSTEVPALTSRDVKVLHDTGLESGLSSLSYEFFGANLGHAGGHNRLSQTGMGDLILLLEPDTYPSPRLLIELLSVLSRDKRIGIVDAREIPMEHPKHFDVLSGQTSWASGCCLMIRRAVFEQVGGFDADCFPLHCDDVDLSWRVRLLGFEVVHAPGATVFRDQEIGSDGYPAVRKTEEYHLTLARLMLATRYGRPDILEQTINQIASGGSEHQRKALDEFRGRQSEGSLPSPVAGAEQVAEFVEDKYARHRF
jgi:GT2 family glycosyltransferase